jgi:hypothetical protein
MMACRLLTLWISLAAPTFQSGGDDVPARTYEVTVDRLDVLAEPDDGAFVTSRLAQGDKVEVRKALAGGWLAIAAPAGSFHWIDDAAVDILRDGRIYVAADKTSLRLGRDGIKTPGPPRSTLLEGAVLRPARQPLLTTDDGRRRKVWRSVAASPDEVRFIRAAGVADPTISRPRTGSRRFLHNPGATGGSPTSAPSGIAPALVGEPPVPPGAGTSSLRAQTRPVSSERKASHDAAADPADLPPELVAPLRSIETKHRAVISRPMEDWELAPIRGEYQALLAKQGNETTRSVVRERLDEVEREDDLAKSARDFEALVKKSRQRDVIIERVKASIRNLKAVEALEYDAEGLLQATARRVDGEKVYSLLDENGQTVTYLRLPTGVDAANFLARQVGVRGKSRFNEGLRYRLLDVNDIEALDKSR